MVDCDGQFAWAIVDLCLWVLVWAPRLSVSAVRPITHRQKSNSPQLSVAPLTVFKETLADVEIHGANIPKDSVVVLDSYSVGMDIVDEPNEFVQRDGFPMQLRHEKVPIKFCLTILFIVNPSAKVHENAQDRVSRVTRFWLWYLNSFSIGKFLCLKASPEMMLRTECMEWFTLTCLDSCSNLDRLSYHLTVKSNYCKSCGVIFYCYGTFLRLSSFPHSCRPNRPYCPNQLPRGQ